MKASVLLVVDQQSGLILGARTTVGEAYRLQEQLAPKGIVRLAQVTPEELEQITRAEQGRRRASTVPPPREDLFVEAKSESRVRLAIGQRCLIDDQD